MNRLWFSSLSFIALCLGPVAARAEGGGMPQLDPSHYVGQLFWLIITFVIIYFLMERVGVPRLNQIIQKRDETVRGYLDQAARLRDQTEAIKLEYERALRRADDEAHAFLRQAAEEIHASVAAQIQEAQAHMNERVAQSERELNTKRDAILGDADKIARELSAMIVKTITDKVA
jgi:F-type H+-transporting ATPase subunit b